MANDSTFVKGFRTNMAYFPESVDYGKTFAVTKKNAYKVGGNVKSLNWTARQNIIKTGSIGAGRNYKQQLYGAYDASGSINWEVSDLSFLRFGAGDIAKFGTGADSDHPYVIVDAELTGIDADGLTELGAGDAKAFKTVRIRPYSILAYDRENATGSTYNESIDSIKGAMTTDITLSGSVGTPLIATTNFIAREISFRRNLTEDNAPDFTETAVVTGDNGNTFAKSPKDSYDYSQEAPLMFYQGKVKYGGNTLALVQSFNVSINNNFRVYRAIGDKFIKMPTTGMRNFSATLNLLFDLPSGSDGNPVNNETDILEIIKNYLGYNSSDSFAASTELTPQLNPIPDSKTITLTFTGTTLSGNDKGAEINLYNATPEGFGHPIQLENGMVEIPVTFNVIGYPYNKAGDGSYTGHDGSVSTGVTSINPIFKFWIS